MNYVDWQLQVPDTITADRIWRMEVYRMALFAGDLGWFDSRKIARDRTLVSLADQLFRAVGSISANICEGYSYTSSKNQARYYEYALGSAREARDWYFKGRYYLGDTVSQHRMILMSEVIRQLLAIIPKHRNNTLKENSTIYNVSPNPAYLQDIPMPDDYDYQQIQDT